MTPDFFSGGTGPDVVLLHGLGSRWQVFAPILPLLTPTHRVLALDLPGFGSRPLDGTMPDVAGYADWVGGELDARGIDRPHVVGSSLGAGIALELGRRGVAARVTAFAPVGFWGRPGRLWVHGLMTVLRAAARTAPGALTRALRTTAGRRILLALLFGRPTRVDPDAAAGDLAALAAASAFAAARDSFRALAPIRPGADVPVDIVWGRRDLVLPSVRQARRARALWPAARHHLLGGCGHLPFSDAPLRCAQLITDTPRKPQETPA